VHENAENSCPQPIAETIGTVGMSPADRIIENKFLTDDETDPDHGFEGRNGGALLHRSVPSSEASADFRVSEH
jgi:hypothetical protein